MPYKLGGYGFPAAVRDALTSSNREVDETTVQVFSSVLAGDLTRLKRDPLAGIKLIQQACRSLGSPLAWSNAAETMAVQSPVTAREYAELLAEIFVLLTVFFWDLAKRSLEPKKQRKVYLLDPIFCELPRALIPGTAPANEDGMVENLLCVGLFRSAASTLIQAGAIPGAVAYWRSSDEREIDFVVPRVSDPRNPQRFPLEMKGDAASNISRARLAIKRSFGQGIVVTRSRLRELNSLILSH